MNPLIGETQSDTLNNVAEALGALLVLLATDHSGLCRIMEPMQQALEHATNAQ